MENRLCLNIWTLYIVQIAILFIIKTDSIPKNKLINLPVLEHIFLLICVLKFFQQYFIAEILLKYYFNVWLFCLLGCIYSKVFYFYAKNCVINFLFGLFIFSIFSKFPKFQLIFVDFLILQLCWINLLALAVFLWVFRIFIFKIILSANRNNSTFPIWMYFVSFSFTVALASNMCPIEGWKWASLFYFRS